MATPPSARGRKSRLVREGEAAHDLVLVVRATPADREGAIAAMVEDAGLSARQYVVEIAPGSREVLYGVSVFARRAGVDVATVVDRFMGAVTYVEVTVGALRAAGFEVYPTGSTSITTTSSSSLAWARAIPPRRPPRFERRRVACSPSRVR